MDGLGPHGVPTIHHPDNRMVQALGAGGVAADVVGGPALAEGVAAALSGLTYALIEGGQ